MEIFPIGNKSNRYYGNLDVPDGGYIGREGGLPLIIFDYGEEALQLGGTNILGAGNITATGLDIAGTGTFDCVVIDGTCDIGLDMSGGTFATASIKLPASTIQSTGDLIFQPTVDSTTGYQWLDTDGGVPILNIDTTNERVGIRKDPAFMFDVDGDFVIRKSGPRIGIGTTSLSTVLNIGSNRIVSFIGGGGKIRATSGDVELEASGRIVLDSTQIRIPDNVGSSRVNIIGVTDSSFSAVSVKQGSGSATDKLIEMVDQSGNKVLGISVSGFFVNNGLNGLFRFPFYHEIGPTPADGDGSGIIFQTENASGVKSDTAYIDSVYDDISQDDTSLRFSLRNSGTPAEVARFNPLGYFGLAEPIPETLLELTHATPYITLHNSTHEDSDGGRESRLIFKGEQSGGEETTLAWIQASHVSTGDDEKGQLGFYTNATADGAAPTLAMHIDETQTLVFDDTVWDDIRVPVSAVRIGGAQPPTETAYKGGMVLSFPTTADKTIYFAVQIPHSYKEGTDIEPHIHWTIPASGAGGGAENVKWDLTYSWANMGVAFPAESSDTITVDVQNDVLDVHMYDEFAVITGTGKTISSMLICSLTRDVAVANDYADGAYLVEVDLHFELDTVGSRTEAAK